MTNNKTYLDSVKERVLIFDGAMDTSVQKYDLTPEEFGGAQFSAFKNALVELSVAKLGPIGAEMKRLVQDHAYIDSVLADGSARAQVLAAETMKAVKDIVGFVQR